MYSIAFGSSATNSCHGRSARASSKSRFYWYANTFSIANLALNEAPCKIAKFIGRKILTPRQQGNQQKLSFTFGQAKA
jgi:hypothetical protein